MPVKVNLNESALRSRLGDDKKLAEKMVAEQILNDCEPFVPKQEGYLRDSKDIRQTDGTEVVWDTPYAAYQYYGCWPDGSHVISEHTTPGTTTHWVEEAKLRYGRDWETVAQNAVRRS